MSDVIKDWPPITNSRLLPRNSTLFERTLTDLCDVELPNPIRTLWNPWTIDITLLPYLAWALSVDLWDERWPEVKKRSVVARSTEMHRLKGTLPGIKQYVELADARVIKALTPPQKTFLMHGLTREERERFVNMMPQLRVFLYRNNGKATHGAFLTNKFRAETTVKGRPFLAAVPRASNDVPYWILTHEDGTPITDEAEPDVITPFLQDEGAFSVPGATRHTRCWPHVTDAVLRFSKRVFYWDRGEETQTLQLDRKTVVEGRDAYDYTLIFKPGLNPYTIFPSTIEKRRLPKRYLVPANAASRTYATRIQRRYDTRFEVLNLNTLPLGAGLDPIDYTPESVFQRGNNKGHGVYPGRKTGFVGDFLVFSTAEERIYDRIYLHDPSRLPENRRRYTHIGHTRLGMRPFHAEIVAEVRGKRYVHATGKYVGGFLVRSLRDPLDRTLEAIRVSKSARDKILVETSLHRPARAADRLRVGGKFKVGQLIRK